MSDNTKVSIISGVSSGIAVSSASYSGIKDWKTLGLIGIGTFVLSGGIYKYVLPKLCKIVKTNNTDDNKEN